MKRGRGYITLSAEAWENIRAEYLGGATASEVAHRWGIAASTIYQRAEKGGWGKKHGGDAATQTRRAEIADTEAARAALLAGIFDVPPAHCAFEALELGARALQASLAASQRGDLSEAAHFVRMAEAYYRIAPKQRFEGLIQIFEVVRDRGNADLLFAGLPDDDPLKQDYIVLRAGQNAREAAAAEEIAALRRRVAEIDAEPDPVSPAS